MKESTVGSMFPDASRKNDLFIYKPDHFMYFHKMVPQLLQS